MKKGFTLKTALLEKPFKLPVINAQPQRGFTLIELVIGIAVLGVVSLILVQLVIRYGQFYQRQQADIGANVDNRQILDDIAASGRQSTTIVVTLTTGGQTYTTSATTLVLKLPAQNLSGEPISGIFDHIIYYQDSSDSTLLRKKVAPDAASSRKSADQVLTSKLKALVFTYDNANLAIASVVNCDLTTTQSEGGQTKDAQDKIQFKLRNF